jgi:hypothetical protein
MFDPRWGDDPRDRDDNSRDVTRGSRGGSDPRDCAGGSTGPHKRHSVNQARENPVSRSYRLC